MISLIYTKGIYTKDIIKHVHKYVHIKNVHCNIIYKSKKEKN